MAADYKPPAPPGRLSAQAKRIWKKIVDEYELEPETIASLEMALDALDLAHRARRRIERDGHVVDGRYGLRVHPSFEVLKASWSAWVAFVRALDLPELDDEAGEQPRAPFSGQFGTKTPRGRGRVARSKAAT